jgi:hypothetical protein
MTRTQFKGKLVELFDQGYYIVALPGQASRYVSPGFVLPRGTAEVRRLERKEDGRWAWEAKIVTGITEEDIHEYRQLMAFLADCTP